MQSSKITRCRTLNMETRPAIKARHQAIRQQSGQINMSLRRKKKQGFFFFLRRSDDRFRESVNSIFVANQLYVKCLTEYIENSLLAIAKPFRSVYLFWEIQILYVVTENLKKTPKFLESVPKT